MDLLRGIVMVIMALDHTRDYFGVAGNPVDLTTTTTALFLTRWVTHICAPTFFLLTGVGARLSGELRTTASLSRLLITRGAWMILAEATLMNWVYRFNFDSPVTGLIVLWALGWAMIVLALLIWLPLPAIVAVGLALILGHNAFDGVRSTHPLWVFLHRPGLLYNSPTTTIFASYPLVPWIGVTAVGYGLGAIWHWPEERRRPFLMRVGAAAILAFVALRIVNTYGDPVRWAQRPSAAMTVLSFINTTKYPPSLLFLCMTLGPALLILRWAERGTPAWMRPVVVYGRVPFLYFVAHFATIHLAAVLVCLARYGSASWMVESPSIADFPFVRPPDWGYSLPWVYFGWICVVAAMYPLCRWFARVKAVRRSPWLSYL